MNGIRSKFQDRPPTKADAVGMSFEHFADPFDYNSAFHASIKGSQPEQELLKSVLHISQITAVVLLFAFLL